MGIVASSRREPLGSAIFKVQLACGTHMAKKGLAAAENLSFEGNSALSGLFCIHPNWQRGYGMGWDTHTFGSGAA